MVPGFRATQGIQKGGTGLRRKIRAGFSYWYSSYSEHACNTVYFEYFYESQSTTDSAKSVYIYHGCREVAEDFKVITDPMTELENDLIRFQLLNGILYSEFKQPVDITVENAQAMIGLRHEISNNDKQYWCLDLHGLKTYPKEAQEYAARYGQEYIHACAAVAKSGLSKFIVNFFIIVKKPSVPVRAFSFKEDAVNWLLEVKRLNEEELP